MRGKDIDVISVDKVSKGISDREVLELAKEERRAIISFDDDFSRMEGTDHCGVIHLTSIADYDLVVRAIADISGNISETEMENTVVELSPKSYR